MSGMQFLRLADAKDDDPQARTLVDLFEKDAVVMVSYFSQVTTLFQDLVASQQHSMSAFRALSQKLMEFEKWGQSFPLGRDDSILSLTLQQFGVALEKMSVMHEVLSRELAKHLSPLQEFAQVERNNITKFQQICHHADEAHDQVLAKYSRLSKKKELETKACIESTEELHEARRNILKTTMDRYSNLNRLQYKRSINLLEPFFGAFKALKQFQTMGEKVHSKGFHDYLGDISASVGSVQSELEKFSDKAVAEATGIEQKSHYFFIPEPTPDMSLKPKPVNKKLNQKGGYLWIRCKSSLSHKWDRKYFFTQGSNLMSQGKNEIAGSLIVDLERCIVQPAEVDDRRFVFQLNDTTDVKRVIILQAISGSEMEEWIYTIRNINTGYTTEGPTTQELSPSLLPTLPYSNQQQRAAPPPPPTSFPQQSAKPPHKGKAESQKTKAAPPKTVSPKSTPPTPPPSPLTSFLPNTPIQFDMISPMQEPQMNGSQPGSPPSENGQMGPPRRINPFNQPITQLRDDQLKASIPGFIQMHTVRFLGSMEVATDKGSEVIMDTIRNIMTARAIHNIFKTTESNLIVTSQDIRLQDLASQTIKSVILLKDISFWSAHHENKRWFAFISHLKNEGSGGKPKFTCQVFETDTLAEEICKSLSIAADIAYKAAIAQNSQNNNRRVSDPVNNRGGNIDSPNRQTWGYAPSQQSPDHGPYTLPREYPSYRKDRGPPSTGPQTGFHAAYLQQPPQGLTGQGLVPGNQGPTPTGQGMTPRGQGPTPGGQMLAATGPGLMQSSQGLVPSSQGQGPSGQGPAPGVKPLPQGLGLLPGEETDELRPGPDGDLRVLPLSGLNLESGKPLAGGESLVSEPNTLNQS